jgi:hypothetical protein
VTKAEEERESQRTSGGWWANGRSGRENERMTRLCVFATWDMLDKHGRRV